MLERDVQIKASLSASFINDFQAGGFIPAASRLFFYVLQGIAQILLQLLSDTKKLREGNGDFWQSREGPSSPKT